MNSHSRKYPRLIVLTLVLICATVVQVAAQTATRTAAHDPEPVRIGVLRGPTAVAFSPLIRDPATLPDGRSVELEIFPSPQVLLPRLISGDLDGATIPSNVAAQLYNRGVPIEVSATFLWGVLYLVGSDEIESIDDLAGRAVHSPGRGATPDLVLRYLLEEHNLDGQVEVVYGFDQVEISQLLIGNRIDAAVLPEPFVTRVLGQSDTSHVISDLQAEWSAATGHRMPQTVLVVVPDTDASAGLRDLLGRSVEAILESPGRYADVVGTLDIGLDAATTLQAIPRLNMNVVSGPESRQALETYFETLYRFEPASIGGSMPDEAFYGQ